MLFSKIGHGLLFCCAMCLTASATTYYVSTTGDDTNDGLSIGSAWARIDRGQPVRLNGNHAAGVTVLTNQYSNTGFPATGAVKVDAETINYTSKTDSTFVLATPTASAHSSDVLIYDNNFNGGAGFSPGDVIEVQSGTYYQQVNIYVLAPNDDNRVTFRANGRVVVDAQGVRDAAFFLYKASYVTLDGFDATGGTVAGIWLNQRASGTIQTYNLFNCNIYGNYGHGISGYLNYNPRTTAPHRFHNCNIVGNGGMGFYSHVAPAGFKDCNIVGNSFGICVNYSGTYGLSYLSNNCFYANGVNFYTVEHPGTRNTADEINGLVFAGESMNNIVTNPCFADLHRGDFSKLFANSPCIGAASDGGNIGPYQSPTIIALSNKTYYVSTTGDDASLNPTAPSSPWRTITKAVSIASAGDTIVISAGSYAGGITITNSGSRDAPLKLLADGPVQIEASGQDYGIRFKRTSAVEVNGVYVNDANIAGIMFDDFGYDNFLFNSGSSNSPSGLLLFNSWENNLDMLVLSTNGVNGICSTNGSYNMNNSLVARSGYDGLFISGCYGITVTNSEIAFNGDDGIQINSCSFNTFSRSRIHHNASDGAYCGGYGSYVPNIIDASMIYNNGAVGVIGPALGAQWYILNSSVYSNDSHGLQSGTNCQELDVQNCTVYANGGSGIINSHYRSGSRQNIVNNIIVDNARYGVEECTTYSGSWIDCNYNLFQNNTMGNYYDIDSASVKNSAAEINATPNCSSNIVDDPRFKPDLRLRHDSPCVDASTSDTNLLSWVEVHDIYQTTRPSGAGIDMGSYEWPDTQGSVFVFK